MDPRRSRSAIACCLAALPWFAACSGGLPEPADSGSVAQPGTSSPPPRAGFLVQSRSGPAPFEAGFVQLDDGGSTSWTWSFGDGATCTWSTGDPAPAAPCDGTGPTANHTYAAPGVYTVSLTASGPGGTRSEVIEDAVEVLETPPIAAFDAATPTAGLVPLSVTLTNESLHATGLTWDFGDGSQVSTAGDVPSVTHTYTLAGSFDVTLRAMGFGGIDETTAIDYVRPKAVPPDPHFVVQVVGSGSSSETVEGALPLTVRFFQDNPATTTSRLWTFHDGTTSTAATPERTYSSPGTFLVALTATGPGGTETEVRADAVAAFDALSNGSFETGTPGQPPAGGWTAFAGNLGGAHGHVNHPSPGLPSTDSGFPTHFSRWCEIDAQSTSSATAPSNPVPGDITNPAVGGAGIEQSFSYRNGLTRLRFDARFLSLEGANGCASGFRDWMSVDVSDGSTTRNLYFADACTPGQSAGSAYYPTALLTPVVNVNFDLAQLFPGSSTATLFTLRAQVGNDDDAQDPSKGYLDNLRLEVSSDGVQAGFAVSPTNANVCQPVCAGAGCTIVEFTDLSTGGPTSWLWDFGDGEIAQFDLDDGSAFPPPPVPVTHCYATTGRKNVRLFVAKAGSSDAVTRSDAVIVYGPPNAVFTASVVGSRSPVHVALANLSQNNLPGLTFEWDFGDGTPGSSAQNPGTHDYLNAGAASITAVLVLTVRTPTSPPLVAQDLEVLTIGPVARYAAEIYPLLNRPGTAIPPGRCAGCHNGLPFGPQQQPLPANFALTADEVFSLLTSEAPVCGQWNTTHPPGRYVIAGNLAASFLHYKVGVATATSQPFPCFDIDGIPPDRTRVMPTAGQDANIKESLRSWIESGASDD